MTWGDHDLWPLRCHFATELWRERLKLTYLAWPGADNSDYSPKRGSLPKLFGEQKKASKATMYSNYRILCNVYIYILYIYIYNCIYIYIYIFCILYYVYIIVDFFALGLLYWLPKEMGGGAFTWSAFWAGTHPWTGGGEVTFSSMSSMGFRDVAEIRLPVWVLVWNDGFQQMHSFFWAQCNISWWAAVYFYTVYILWFNDLHTWSSIHQVCVCMYICKFKCNSIYTYSEGSIEEMLSSTSFGTVSGITQ